MYPALVDAVEQGLISEDIIDRAITRLFIARFRLGMFDPPEQVPYAQTPYEIIDSLEHRELALEAARQSIVLLKNDGNLLPLRKDLESIAVIGPNADNLQVLLGNYNGTPARSVTLLEGIRRKISPATKIYYAQGCGLADGVPPLEIISPVHLRPENANADEKGLTAAYYDNPRFEANPVLSQVDQAIDFIWKDTTPLTGRWGDHFAVRWSGFLVPSVTGTYWLGVNGFSAYALYLDGELLVDYQDIHHPVLKIKQVELEAGRFYRLQLDYVSQGLDPQIQLLWSPPGLDYEARALEAARKADVVVAVMGLSPALEGEEMPVDVDGFAGGDRTDIGLPRPQEELLKKIHALGKPAVLVLLNGSALAVNWAAEHLPAILEAWYPGQAGGEAIADVVFGDYNPGGRLPITFYKSVEDLPPFEDYQMEGRTYRFFRGEPLFPFGYGLSYTNFEFDKLDFDRTKVEVGNKVNISLDVTNTGNQTGDEVVQLYIRHLDATVSHPIKELKGFKRITLRPEERKTVTFTLHSHQLGFYDAVMQFVVQPGLVEVMVGNSSQHLPLTGTIEIVGQRCDMSLTRVFYSQVKVL